MATCDPRGVIEHKRGDSFIRDCSVLSDGDPLTIVGWQIRSHVRRGSKLIAALDVTILDAAAGRYQLACMNTAAWPVGELSCDIEYTMPSGQIASTRTFFIDCLQDETQ